MRLAGGACLSLVEKHFRPKTAGAMRPFVLRYGQFLDLDGELIDEVTAVHMPHGQSYTGLEQIEVFCHGGRYVVRRILNELLKSGARAAEPGEFTKLAFLSGRIDLSRAEAVAEMVRADTGMSYETAREHLLGAYTEHVNSIRSTVVSLIAEVEASVDFPDEGIETEDKARMLGSIGSVADKIQELVASYSGGRILKEGFRIAIGGRPNAGKSSLFNLLLRQERALVTPTAGTTRDYLSEWIDLDGYAVNLIDTAGIRKGGGQIEKAGQESARKLMRSADLTIWMVDLSMKNWKRQLKTDLKQLSDLHMLLLGNKIDLLQSAEEVLESGRELSMLTVSCRTNQGIGQFRNQVLSQIEDNMPDLTPGLVVTSERHAQKFRESRKSLQAAKKNLEHDESPEIIAFDLRSAANAIDEITGKIYNEDILEEIFSKFCIGK